MKHFKKFILLVICFLIFTSISSRNAVCDTTIRDTTFSPNIGDRIQWSYRVLLGVHNKLELTIEDMYDSNPYFMIDGTLRYYNATSKEWTIRLDNTYIVSANETLDYVDYNSYLLERGFILLIPIPINLTMIGEYLIASPYFTTYEISSISNRLSLHTPYIGGQYYLDYNSKGLLSNLFRYIGAYSEPYILIQLLDVDDVSIPYGFHFLIFTSIGIIGLVYLKWRKTNL